GFDPCAADEVRHRTLLAVYLQCFDYDSKRGSLIAFTLNHANYCVKEYWREQQRRRREVPFGPDEDEAAALHEYLIKFLNETDPWLFDEELGELRAAAKLQLLEVLLELNRRADQLAVFVLNLLPDMEPRDILEAYWLTPLSDAVNDAEHKWLDATDLPPDCVQAAFKRLRSRMKQRLGKVLEGKKIRPAFRGWLSKQVGKIPLGEYL